MFDRRDEIIELVVTQELLDYFATSNLAVQIWGHNVNITNEAISTRASTVAGSNDTAYTNSPTVSRKAAAMLGIQVTPENERQAAHQRFSERWRNHKHNLKMWCEVLELDDHGQYAPVGSHMQKGVHVGPVLQIRQGFARRINIKITPDPADPLLIKKVSAVHFGDVEEMSITQCDARYSSTVAEADVDIIREQFSSILNDRCGRLDTTMRGALADDSMDEDEKSTLIEQWMSLVAERDALLRPEPDSGLPGARSFKPVEQGYEARNVTVYHPVSDDATVRPVVERGDKLTLHMITQQVSQWSGETSCTVSWDATAHNDPQLLRLTDSKNILLMKLQIECQLANSGTEMTLTKLVAFRVYKRTYNFKDSSKSFFSFTPTTPTPRGTGAQYEVVTSLPSFESEDDITEETQTESATVQYQKSKDRAVQFVQIDQLKQALAMQSPKATLPDQLRNIVLGAEGRRQSSTLRRGQTVPSNLTASANMPSTTLESELESKLRLAELAGDVTISGRIRTQLDSMRVQRNNSDSEWVVLNGEPASSTGVHPPRMRPSSCPTFMPGVEPDAGGESDEAPVSGVALRSMMALFRQKLSGATSIEELQVVGQLISLAKEDQNLPDKELKILRDLYRTRARALPSSGVYAHDSKKGAAAVQAVGSFVDKLAMDSPAPRPATAEGTTTTVPQTSPPQLVSKVSKVSTGGSVLGSIGWDNEPGKNSLKKPEPTRVVAQKTLPAKPSDAPRHRVLPKVPGQAAEPAVAEGANVAETWKQAGLAMNPGEGDDVYVEVSPSPKTRDESSSSNEPLDEEGLASLTASLESDEGVPEVKATKGVSAESTDEFLTNEFLATEAAVNSDAPVDVALPSAEATAEAADNATVDAAASTATAEPTALKEMLRVRRENRASSPTANFPEKEREAEVILAQMDSMPTAPLAAPDSALPETTDASEA